MRQTSQTPEDFFHQLFNTYKTPVYAYVYKITQNPHIAEEITQELFIKLWVKRDQYHEIQNMDQYIYRMAHNACMTWFGKLALNERVTREIKNRLALQDNSVENHMDLVEAKALLAKAVESLSPQRRKVFELSRNQGLKLPEIAKELHVSVSTANHHLVAALAQLRKYLLDQHKGKSTMFLLLVFSLFEK